jgi:hypothetical protein
MTANLETYVTEHVLRGACVCGKCFDQVENPENNQPSGHTVNLTFFEVAINPLKIGNKEEFLELVRTQYSGWLDGKEHNYIEMGAQMGSQELALETIGLGHLLGAWKAFSPDILFPYLPKEFKMNMAGNGMVVLRAEVKDE